MGAAVEADAGLSPMIPDEVPEGYPRELEQWIELPDGHRMFVRPMIPSDAARLEYAFAHADTETLQMRFFTAAPPMDRAHLDYLTRIDYRRRLALVGMDESGAGVGIGRYERIDDETAEVAIVVDPTRRRRSVGSKLLLALERPARANGYMRLVALYLPSNKAVEGLLRGIGYGDRRMEESLVSLCKPLVPPES